MMPNKPLLPVPVKFIKTTPLAVAPTYGTDGAAGFDLYSVERVLLQPMKPTLISTGLCVEIPYGYEIQIRSRSGLALNKSVMVLNSPGTIDSDYRGVVKVMLMNFGEAPIVIDEGDRIAQGVLAVVEKVQWIETESLSDTQRGAGGFGSTGM